jgi:DNA-binding MarR family transcriptional regulator
MKGRQLIQDSIDARQRWMQELTDALTPEEQESISVALTTLSEAALDMESTLETECAPKVG